MFEERMKTSAIPERVYALCVAIKNRGIQENELIELLEPSGLGGKTSYFGSVRDAAKQLGLITIKEGKISLAVDKKNLSSLDAMRKYIVSNIDSVSNGLFYAVSKEYFLMNERIYEFSSVSDAKLIELMSKNVGSAVFEDDMRAWRFWAAYLGFGILHQIKTQGTELLLPNTQQYLKNVLDIVGLEKKKEYTFSEFIAAVRPYCDIVIGDIPSDKRLNMAFSNGLRALHDEGIIQLSHKLDRGDMWFLYEAELHSVKSTVTHIVVRR